MSQSAQRSAFIAEAVDEAIPVVVCGGETPLKKALIKEISSQDGSFVGLSDGELKNKSEILPWRVVWVQSPEEDWIRALRYARQFHSQFIAIVYGNRAERILKDLEKEEQGSGVIHLSREPEKNEIAAVSEKIVKNIFLHRGGAWSNDISLPEREQEKERFHDPREYEQLEKKIEHTSILEEKLPPPILTREARSEQHSPLTKKQAIDRGERRPTLMEDIFHDSVREPDKKTVHISKTVVLAPTVPTKTKLFSHLPEEVIFEKNSEREKHTHDRVLSTIFTGQKKTDGEKKKSLSKEKIGSVRSTPHLPFKIPKFFHTKKMAILGGIAAFLAIPFFFWMAVDTSFSLTAQQTYATLIQQKGGNLEKNIASNHTDNALLIVHGYQKVLQAAASFLDPIGLSQGIEYARERVVVVERTLQAMKVLERINDQSKQLLLSVTQRGDQDPLELIQSMQTQIDQTDKELALVTNELSLLPSDRILATGVERKEVEESISGLRRTLAKSRHLLSVLPDMLGAQQKKTYLILIQNPLELRASGGYLESFAFITVDKGRVLDVQVQDVASADNQLKGKVDPPADLQAALGETQWYLRDSNWDVSFPIAARQSEWFVEKELGRVVDGSVSINAYTLQELLKITGPVLVESGGASEEITSENIIERLYAKSEALFTVQQVQTRGFLSSVATLVFDALQQLPEEKASALGDVLLRSLESGQMMIGVKDPVVHQILSQLGVTGAIMTPPCPQMFATVPCVVDTIYQVDSNIGINRVNMAVTRLIEHHVILSHTSAAHTYRARYTNTATTTAWPSGIYKNYIRLAIPDYAQVNSVVVNNVPMSANLIRQEVKNGKRELGFSIEVPVGKTVEVEVNYVSNFSQQAPFSYALFTQKQAGTVGDPVSFSVNIQSPLRPVKLAPDGSVSGSLVQFDTTLDKHQYLAVEVQ